MSELAVRARKPSLAGLKTPTDLSEIRNVLWRRAVCAVRPNCTPFHIKAHFNRPVLRMSTGISRLLPRYRISCELSGIYSLD